MIFNFLVKTRVVHGIGALGQLADIVKTIGLKRPLVVTDPQIGSAPFFTKLCADLRAAHIDFAIFDQCAVDARLEQVDRQAARIRAEQIDGVIAAGGGSVMGAAKGMAIVATNAQSFREVNGFGNFKIPALPTIMIPTTAGSGSEVSQVTVIKDDEAHKKLVGGGPLSFPNVAILDPATLESLPARPAAYAAVDALTHALEGYFSSFASPLTDSIALGAIKLLMGCIRASIVDGDVQARSDNLLGSAMANMVSGNARVGLAHGLSLALEGTIGLPHGLGVGVLMPRVVEFNAPASGVRMIALAQAFGIAGETDPQILAGMIAERLYALYREIGFPVSFSDEWDRSKAYDMAVTAVPDLLGLAPVPSVITSETRIGTAGLRACTVREAEAIYVSCFAA